jgi:hypothetical protein
VGNEILRFKLAKLLNHEWNVESFQNIINFKKKPLDIYDIIVSDRSLISTNNRKLFEKIIAESEIELFLLGDSFEQNDVNNEHIKGLIDSNNISSIINDIRYIDKKLKIQKLAQEDKQELENIREILLANS